MNYFNRLARWMKDPNHDWEGNHDQTWYFLNLEKPGKEIEIFAETLCMMEIVKGDNQ